MSLPPPTEGRVPSENIWNAPPPRNRNQLALVIGAIVLAVIVAVILIVFFVTRDNNDSPTVNPTPTVSAPVAPPAPATPTPQEPNTDTPATPQDSSENAFITGLRTHPYWTNIDTDKELKLGHVICSAYDQGASTAQILAALVRDPSNGKLTGIPSSEASWVRAVTVVTLCPAYRNAP